MSCSDDLNAKESKSQDPKVGAGVYSTQFKLGELQPCPDQNAGLLVVGKFALMPVFKTGSLASEEALGGLGYTGLLNGSNNCFANAVLQALANTWQLKSYFAKSYYVQDLVNTNSGRPQMKVICAFASFLKEMWSGRKTTDAYEIVALLCGDNEFFNDGSQHDAQEFLSFLLDCLHEGLKRQQPKFNKVMPAETGENDDITLLAQRAWDNYNEMNGSIIVDTFHGLVCSQLVCLFCGKASTTYDPFVFVSVPLPKQHKIEKVYYWPAKFDEPPVLFRPPCSFSNDARFEDLLATVGQTFNTSPSALIAVGVLKSRIVAYHKPGDRLFTGSKTGTIFIFERLEDDSDGGIVSLFVTQVRVPLPRSQVSSLCAYCMCQLTHGFSVQAYKSANGADFMDPIVCEESMRGFEESCDMQSIIDPTDFLDEVASLDDGVLIREMISEEQNELNSPRISHTSRSVLFNKPYVTGSAGELIDFRNSEQENKSPCFYIMFPKSAQCIYEEQIEDESDDALASVESTDQVVMCWRISASGSPCSWVESKDSIECVGMLNPESANGRVNLIDMMRYFTDPEILAGEESWYCDRCCKRQMATKTLNFWQLPPVLIIQIKRFSYTSFFLKKKIETPVRYPLKNFDMKPYLNPKAPEQITKYDLYAMVSHTGNCNYGHYVAQACLLSENGSECEVGWRHFNDTEVRDLTSIEDDDPNVYFLFYARQNFYADEFFKSYNNQRGAEAVSSRNPDSNDQMGVWPGDDIPGSSSST
ncbi:ubiquitin carboxyl terminal hydrolase [Trichuris trichiura]|uniref:ubiquitinyl hydrolase 1 n=1 Tax=Trichuris trichiura TaxID=36087 RepID=A0A077YXX5_TRITR|nr:ubiquitin carboxyl terminal hydrolase [Trichuris trichiura]